MRRTLVFTFGFLALAACENEHGDAMQGAYDPGGPIDNRGNAATIQALEGERPIGSAEAPDVYVEVEHVEPWHLSDRFDAGGQELSPLPANYEEVVGRVISVNDDSIRIAPEQGQPISLRLEPPSQITLEGSLIAPQALVPGSEVRASYIVEQGQAVANNVAMQPSPATGPGLWQEQLQAASPFDPSRQAGPEPHAMPQGPGPEILEQEAGAPDTAAIPHGPAAGAGSMPIPGTGVPAGGAELSPQPGTGEVQRQDQMENTEQVQPQE